MMLLETWMAAPIGALLIFLLRMVDVSMAIMRMIIAVRGQRGLAAMIGFFEVLLWLMAVGAALEHLDSPLHVVGYAAGFAAGNYVGVWLEGRFAMGINVVRAVFRADQEGDAERVGVAAAQQLRAAGFAVTEMGGRGKESEVDILNVVVPRRQVPRVLHVVREADPNVFATVEEIRSAQGGYVRPAGRKVPFLTRQGRRSLSA